MHRRKSFLVYQPNGRYKVRHSKRQAWKLAVRMGEGASIDVSIHIHPAKRTRWVSSFGRPLWDVVSQEQ